MATLAQGILGGFSGKVGTVVGSIWKGISTIRSYNPNPTNPRTPAQLEQRAKFSLVGQFLRILTAFIRESFANQANKMTAYNAAVQINLAKAITGIFPDFSIDYSKVVLSKGNLANASNLAAVSTIASQVHITWDDNTGDGGALATDTAMVVVYNPLLQKAYSTVTGPERSMGELIVTLPESFSGLEVDVYVSFKNKENISNSEHLGPVTVL